MQVYLVGGAVRDALLGLAVQERDWVVVGGTREELLRMNYREVGRDSEDAYELLKWKLPSSSKNSVSDPFNEH